MRIAIGFDGTIVDNKYPEIGKEKPCAVRVIKKLIEEGNEVILWTSRSGERLTEATEWCLDKGITLYSVNSNHPGYVVAPSFKGKSCKISADVYVDGANLGGLPDWWTIYRLINLRRNMLHKKYCAKHDSKSLSYVRRFFFYLRGASKEQRLFYFKDNY